MHVTITVRGLQELVSRTEPIRNGRWAQNAVREGIAIVSRGIKERFDAEVDPDGSPWAALKPSTLRRKTGEKKLVQSGALRSSIRVVGINALASKVVAADMPGKFHEHGTTKMVARPFMGISQTDETKVMNMMQRRLRELGA